MDNSIILLGLTNEKHLFVLLSRAIFLVITNANAQDIFIPGTDYFKDDSETKDNVILSTSGICHDKNSTSKSQLKIFTEGNRKTKVYRSLDECLKDGGKVRSADKNNLKGDDLFQAGKNENAGEVKTEDRKDFANDRDNLLLVQASLNRQKGAKGLDEWLPPNHKYRCQHIAHFNQVMDKYSLKFTPSEQRIVNKMIKACT